MQSIVVDELRQAIPIFDVAGFAVALLDAIEERLSTLRAVQAEIV